MAAIAAAAITAGAGIYAANQAKKGAAASQAAGNKTFGSMAKVNKKMYKQVRGLKQHLEITAPEVDPGDIGAKVREINAANIPALRSASTQLSDQILSQMDTALPGWRNLRDTALSNAGSFLKGEVPQEDLDLLRMVGAENLRSSGFAEGSAIEKKASARNLGLYRNDLMKLGDTLSKEWVQIGRRDLMTDPMQLAPYYLTDFSQVGTVMQNNANRQLHAKEQSVQNRFNYINMKLGVLGNKQDIYMGQGQLNQDVIQQRVAADQQMAASIAQGAGMVAGAWGGTPSGSTSTVPARQASSLPSWYYSATNRQVPASYPVPGRRYNA